MATRRPQHLVQREWDPSTARYADLSHPEWLDRVPVKFWEDPHNHKRYMQWLAIQLNIKKLDDWYRVYANDFHSSRGTTFLTYYEAPGSHISAIKAHFPGRQWHEWLFPQAPSGFWKVRANRQRYMNWLGKRLGYRKMSDWYQLTQQTLEKNYCGGMLDHFSCSPQRILEDTFPKEDWKAWLFGQASNGFWKTKENRCEYLRWLEQRLGIRQPDDWYQVTPKDFHRNYGGALMTMYNKGRVAAAIKELYPKHPWIRWRFQVVGRGFWDVRTNRLEYLAWLGEKLGFRTLDDWMKLQTKHFVENGGFQVLEVVYEGDLTRPVREMFPGSDCQPWMFVNTPQRFWTKPENRIRYVKWLGKRLGFRTKDDWYSLTPKTIRDNHGRKLLQHGSVAAVVGEAFPNRKFYPWLFTRLQYGFWKNPQNRNAWFDWLAVKLRIKNAADWDQVQLEQHDVGNIARLLRQNYGGESVRLIQAAKRRFRQMN